MVFQHHKVGNAIGSIFGGPISDRFGRRKTLVYGNIVVSIFGFCSYYSPTWETFAICYVVIWSASSVCYLVGSVYVIEARFILILFL